MLRTLKAFPLISAFLVLAAYGQAQTLLISQNQLLFSAQPGSVSLPQTLQLSTTSGSLAFQLSFTPVSGPNWLTVNQANGALPATITIVATAAGLAPGVYIGTLTITANGATNSPVQIPVTFNVGTIGTSSISVNPLSLTFNGQTGGSNPPGQGLVVNPVGSPVSFIALPATANGTNWLQVSPTGGTAPSALNVTVNTTGLASGSYSGTITLAPTSGPSVTIPVTLNLGSSSVLNVSSTNLQFYAQAGGALPDPQNVSFTADGGSPLSFTLTPSTTSGNWLSVTPVTATTPYTVTVAANPYGLAIGTYTGTIQVTTPSASTPIQTINVRLTIGTGTQITVGSPPQIFRYQTGGAVPGGQAVQIGSTGGPLPFTAVASSTGGWLVVGPSSGTTPQNLTVGVNPGSLTTGTYTGVVTVTSPGAQNSPVSFNVTLVVNSPQTFSATPASLNFSYQIGSQAQVPQQIVQVSTALPTVVSVTAATSTCGNWLQVYPSQLNSPANLTVSVNTFGFNLPQICSGVVTLTAAGYPGAIQVPVTLNISNSPLLNVSPTSFRFAAPFDSSPPAPQTLSLTSTASTALSYTTSINYGSAPNWLNLGGPPFGSTPQDFTLVASPAGLSPGTYTASIVINSPGLPTPQSVPVTFVISPVTTVSAAPAALAFTQQQGGSAPPSQSVTIGTLNGSFNFTATPSTNGGLGWLSVSQTGGTTPATISISAAGSTLPAGTYNGAISIAVPGAGNNPLVIPVTMTVISGTSITANPGTLNFTYQLGNPVNPANQVVSIASQGGAVNYTSSALTTSGGNWLSVSPAAATTPGSVTISVNPSGLAPGTYGGQVAVVAPGVLGSPLIIPVTLVIQPAAGPVVASIANGASGGVGVVAPGQIMTIKGIALGPAAGAGLTVNGLGLVDTAVAGTRVLFDGVPGPILYTSERQINVIAPYEIQGKANTLIQAEYQGVRSQAQLVPVSPTYPGIFTSDSTGSGQAASLNQDNTLNSASNPADRGSIIQVFATGEGATDPPGITGAITSTDIRRPLEMVTATLGGIPAEIKFAGSAPQSVLGLLQVNIRIPPQVAPGAAVPLTIKIGSASSQAGVTVAIR